MRLRFRRKTREPRTQTRDQRRVKVKFSHLNPGVQSRIFRFQQLEFERKFPSLKIVDRETLGIFSEFKPQFYKPHIMKGHYFKPYYINISLAFGIIDVLRTISTNVGEFFRVAKENTQEFFRVVRSNSRSVFDSVSMYAVEFGLAIGSLAFIGTVMAIGITFLATVKTIGMTLRAVGHSLNLAFGSHSINVDRIARVVNEAVLTGSFFIGGFGIVTGIISLTGRIRKTILIHRGHEEMIKDMQNFGVLETKFEGYYPQDWMRPAIIKVTHPVFFVKTNGDVVFIKEEDSGIIYRLEHLRFRAQQGWARLGIHPWTWRAYIRMPQQPDKVIDFDKVGAGLAAET